MTIHYIVTEIDGDYAILKTADGIENRVAMALLPEGVDVGVKVVFENFAYEIE